MSIIAKFNRAGSGGTFRLAMGSKSDSGSFVMKYVPTKQGMRDWSHLNGTKTYAGFTGSGRFAGFQANAGIGCGAMDGFLTGTGL